MTSQRSLAVYSLAAQNSVKLRQRLGKEVPGWIQELADHPERTPWANEPEPLAPTTRQTSASHSGYIDDIPNLSAVIDRVIADEETHRRTSRPKPVRDRLARALILRYVYYKGRHAEVRQDESIS